MIKMFFPFIEWLKDYSVEKLKIDALSGLTVALVLIPQSMGLCPVGRDAVLLWAVCVISPAGHRIPVRSPAGNWPPARWRWSL